MFTVHCCHVARASTAIMTLTYPFDFGVVQPKSQMEELAD